MRRRSLAVLMIVAMAASACSVTSTTPTTIAVDDAPELIKSMFLTVSRRAAALTGYEATSDEWFDFAREVCASDPGGSDDLAEFVDDWAGSGADQTTVLMWATVADAATTSFCPIERT